MTPKIVSSPAAAAAAAVSAAATPEAKKKLALVKLNDVPASDKWVVKPGDSIWLLAQRTLGDRAELPEIQAFVDQIKADNPAIATEARKNGDLIFAGDELRKPKGAWVAKGGSSKPSGGKVVGTKADAEAQMAAGKLAKEQDAQKQLRAFSELVRNVPDDHPQFGVLQGEIRKVLTAMPGLAPKLVDSPESFYLRSRLPAGDPLKKPSGGQAEATDASAPADERSAARDERAAVLESWAGQSRSTPLPLQARLKLGAALDDTQSQFPELMNSKAVQQLKARAPIAPEDAATELGLQLSRMADALSTEQTPTDRERRGLLRLVSTYAPVLIDTPEFEQVRNFDPNQ